MKDIYKRNLCGVKKNIRDNTGYAIVEASIIFPIMFLVLFTLIYMGNLLHEKSKIEGLVTEYAVLGAQYCADPILAIIKETGYAPTSAKDVDVKPYRYWLGGMQSVEDDISQKLSNEINQGGVRFFTNMKPKVSPGSQGLAKFNNYILYSTFTVEVPYAIKFPISFWGNDKLEIMEFSARAEVPAGDMTEFIRNTDMALDMFTRTGLSDKIKSYFDKAKKFLGLFN